MITTAGTSTEYNLNSVSIVADPDGIVSDPQTNSLWITEDFYGYIGEISTSGSVLKQYKVPGNGPSPSAITVDSSGNIWFSEQGLGNNQIGELDPSTGQFTMYDLPAGATTYGITVGPDGNIWFTDQGNKAIGVINVGGASGPTSPTPTRRRHRSPTPTPTPSPTPSPTSTGTGVITTIAPGVTMIVTTMNPGSLTPLPAAPPVSVSLAHKPRHPRRPVHRRSHQAPHLVQVSPAHSTPGYSPTSLVETEASVSAREPHHDE